MVHNTAPVNRKSAEFGMIGKRLKEERERLGMTQPQFAEAAGAAKRTLIEWEKGATSPNAVQLSALFAHGADVTYIITGVRSCAPSVPTLSREEECLLDNYRHSPEDQKAIIQATSAAFAQSNQVKKTGKKAG